MLAVGGRKQLLGRAVGVVSDVHALSYLREHVMVGADGLLTLDAGLPDLGREAIGRLLLDNFIQPALKVGTHVAPRALLHMAGGRGAKLSLLIDPCGGVLKGELKLL